MEGLKPHSPSILVDILYPVPYQSISELHESCLLIFTLMVQLSGDSSTMIFQGRYETPRRD